MLGSDPQAVPIREGADRRGTEHGPLFVEMSNQALEEKSIVAALVTARPYLAHVQLGESNRLAPGQGIDVRPQNGMLYALGVNDTTDTATLYVLSTTTDPIAETRTYAIHPQPWRLELTKAISNRSFPKGSTRNDESSALIKRSSNSPIRRKNRKIDAEKLMMRGTRRWSNN